MKTIKDDTDVLVVLILSGAMSLGMVPFLIIRYLSREWLIFALDAGAFFATLTLFLYVYVTRKTAVARWLVAILCVVVMFLTVHIKGIENLMWIYPGLAALFFLLIPNVALAIGSVFLLIVTIMVWPQVTPAVLAQFLVTTISLLLFCFAFSYRARKQQQELSSLATVDALTGAENRRALEEALLSVTGRLSRYPEQRASVLMIDLDEFKTINDTFGHGVGDAVLKSFSETIQSRIRASDGLYRFGGEEFVVIAEHTSLKEAHHLAETLRLAIEQSSVHDGVNLTISLGVAEYSPGESSYQWLGRADAALYRAKQTGRNVSCTA
ncbi:GGDEF domain-containing protein [Alteromonas sp. ASW11-19]|uniref:diguanylate cyclase n=1 Tax=Alteromonas salexigens TaxID=2982530 RepID=A0ABT2VK92_9ALTE|nr:GGDEF domain-containing protein [Alteromonas salexigens]MCU7553217.1 GGDEF domain-containing protein [Alteromonas salexigens]